MKQKLIGLVCCCIMAFQALSTTRSVPGTYASIQAALNACVAGDTVYVDPGTYAEQISWPNIAAIKLLSLGNSTNTIISGSNSGIVIEFNSTTQVDTTTVIRGFTITEGFYTGTSSYGSGLFIEDCSPTIELSNITDNHSSATYWAHGAGVYCENSDAVFRHCTISGNMVDTCTWGFGGGVCLASLSNPRFENVAIENNLVNSGIYAYAGGVYGEDGTAGFLNCRIVGNQTTGGSYHFASGMYFEDSRVTLTNVLVARNESQSGGSFYYAGGIYLRSSTGSAYINLVNVTIADNRISNNGALNGSGLFLNAGDSAVIVNSILWNPNSGPETGGSGTVTASFSDIRGIAAGSGNINVNPGFASAFDYHLTATSPCINAGTLAGSPNFDLDNLLRPSPAGTNPDIGCYEYNQPVGMMEMSGKASLVVFPNPAFTRLEVSLPVALEETTPVKIFDLNGSMVQSLEATAGTTSLPLSIQHLAAGNYIVQVGDAHCIFVKE